MTQNEAREAMLADWMARPPKERQTEHQAAVFTMKAMARYAFRGDRDRYRLIMAWLRPHIPRMAE